MGENEEEQPQSAEDMMCLECCYRHYALITNPPIENGLDKRGYTIKHLQDLLHRKNVQLDAMDWVWCSGGCDEGLHRFNDLPDLTEEMVKIAEQNTLRLRKHYENVKFQKKGG